MRSANLPTTGFLAMLFQRILLDAYKTMDYLSHLPETKVNRAYCQKILVVKNGSFMRNKRHVFFVCVCPNIYGQQKYFDHMP